MTEPYATYVACPLEQCDWTLRTDDLGTASYVVPDLTSDGVAAVANRMVRAQAQAQEEAIRDHLQGHDPLDYLRTIADLRARLGDGTRDGDPRLICAVCMYVPPRPGLDEDEVAATAVLTVQSGILVCERHINCVRDFDATLHRAIITAVRMESGDRFDEPGAYHRWRTEQLREDRS